MRKIEAVNSETKGEIKQHRLPCKAEMVRAFLDKEHPKTQTRRLNGLQFINKHPEQWILGDSDPDTGVFYFKGAGANHGAWCNVISPYGRIGDIILITETWKICGYHLNEPELQIAYKESSSEPYDAEWRTVDWQSHEKYKQANYFTWHTGRFMPTFASRIRRVILDIRYQRIQDISEEDAIAEGLKKGLSWDDKILGHMPLELVSYLKTPIFNFSILWDSIHVKDGFGWDFNPWVGALKLKEFNEEVAHV